MKNSIKSKLTPGLFRTHEYVSYKVAPATDNTNEDLHVLMKSFSSIRNNQMFKSLRDGQPIIAHELYADSKESFYLYTVPVGNRTMLKEKIQSVYKGGGVKEYIHSSWPFVSDCQNTLISYLHTTKAPFFPNRMDTSMLCKDILYVTEELKKDEKVFIQMLIDPVEDGWQDEMERAYELYLNGGDADSGGSILKSGGRKLDKQLTNLLTSLAKEEEPTLKLKRHREIKEFNQKIRQTGYHVVVRVAVYAKTYERRNDIIESIASCYKGTGYHNSWQMSPVIRKKSTLEALRTRKMPVLTTASLLCDDELQVLLRMPTKDIVTRKLERMKPDETTVDERVTRDIIPIGRSIEYDTEGSLVGFSVANRDTASKARLWIAPPGSGKSTAVKIFKNGAMESGHGGSIFDVADGRLYLEAIETTPEEERGKLVLVNFADERYPHIFNFSSLGRDSDTVGAMFAEFFEVYFKTAHNHRMNSFLRKAAMTVFTNPDATFLELILLMRDEEYRRKFLPTIRKSNPELFLWWKTEFPKIVKSESQVTEILQPILYRLDNLQYNKRLGPIFCGTGGKLDIFNWMNQGKWVLYNLSNGVFLENEQRMMMSFLNYGYWTATLMREEMLQQGQIPPVHHKMYDEPQTYMDATPIFELSISKSRKYGVSDNFFIQNPSQVSAKNEALWQQIIGMNPHILVGGGLDLKNLKIMAQELNISVEDLKQLEQLEYHWYFKTYVGKSALPPFIFHGLDVPEEFGRDKKLEEYWRNHFAPRSYEEVKLHNNARNLKMSIKQYQDLLASYDEPDEEEGVKLGEDT